MHSILDTCYEVVGLTWGCVGAEREGGATEDHQQNVGDKGGQLIGERMSSPQLHLNFLAVLKNTRSIRILGQS